MRDQKNLLLKKLLYFYKYKGIKAFNKISMHRERENIEKQIYLSQMPQSVAILLQTLQNILKECMQFIH